MKPLLTSVPLWLLFAASAAAQAPFEMRLQLGPNRELDVTATYYDPTAIDQRLNGTRVVPMRVSATNHSAGDVELRYNDVTLDLGTDGGLTHLLPIPVAAARRQLRADAAYNGFVAWFGQQGDRFSRIDPFAQVLSSGTLRRGATRTGYVFFLRPEKVPYSNFLALGIGPSAMEILKTSDVDVMSPETEASSLWPATMNSWPSRFTASLGNAVREITSGPPPYRKSYALLMGVSNYQFLEQLPRVKADLDNMSAMLQRLGFTVVRIENEKLTMANVKSPQQFFANVANIGPDDRLLVFFAGHGFQRLEGGRTRGYLALTGGRSGDANPQHTIAMDDFVTWTEGVRAKHLLVLLESCFSGLAVRGHRIDVEMMGAAPPAAPDPRALYQLSKDPGRYLLMAGDENQRVPMSDAWGGGLFAHAVIAGLSGNADGDKDGFVTARELYPWLRRYVEREAMRVLGTSVTPLIKDLDPGVSKGEFVFTTAR